jgi:predicted alpha-1,6-mannanase (GH76 family)
MLVASSWNRPGWLVRLCLATAAAALLASAAVAPASAAGRTDYRSDAGRAAAVLQRWYTPANGLFATTGWWNSANALNAIVDYSRRTGSTAYRSDISTTFDVNAPKGFINRYYDDEGWWALTWVNAYDLTHDSRYLAMARSIFADIRGGWDSVCGGGVWWNKSKNYKNAIPNELFLTLAVRLHERTPGDHGSSSYLDWAKREWSWFAHSGMINSSGLVNDGLNVSTCTTNKGTTWTYNQGVLLAGLAGLFKSTGNAAYLRQAETTADAATRLLVDRNGILTEPCPTSCNGDQAQFKGIFTRNLFALYEVSHRPAYRTFILRNAGSIWANDRNPQDQLGLQWAGPFDKADAARQSSALDALNAAIPLGAR